MKNAITILILGFLARLAVAGLYPLLPDETYYWVWSRDPHAAYFDHPGGIAWVIAHGTALFGDTPFGVRSMPVLLGLIAGLALAAAARRLASGSPGTDIGAGDRAAVHAALLMTLLPLSAAGYVLATPDAPLLAGIAVTWWAVLAALDDRTPARQRLGWWALAGLAIGAAMASKFTGVLIPAALALSCALLPRYREVFRTPGPYVAVLVASLVMTPTLLWNAANDWVTFRFQLAHGLGTPPDASAAATLTRVAELIGGQLGLSGIVLGALMASAAWQALRGRSPEGRPIDDALRLLARASLLCALFFVFSAMRKPVEANWPAIAYPSLVLVLAVAFAQRRFIRPMRWGYGIALAFTLLAYSAATVLPPSLIASVTRDPFDRAHGWDDLADAMDLHKTELSAVVGDATVHLVANRYQDASELNFHAAGRPFVPSLNINARRNHYDYWPGFAERARVGDAMLLALDTLPRALPVIDALAPHFGQIAEMDVVPLTRGDRPVAWRRLWLFIDWKGTWPARDTTPLPSTPSATPPAPGAPTPPTP